jgi:hypothetical protein
MMAKKRTWDPANPFERIKKEGELRGESQKANQALHDYYAMGMGRSLPKLHKLYVEWANSGRLENSEPPTKRLGALFTWSADFDWQERVLAKKVLDDAEFELLWQERRLQLREQEWDLAGKMLKVGERIMDEAPLFVKQQRRFIKGEEGQPDREVITMALDGHLGVRAAETGSKLARLAAEMESERKKIEFAVEKEMETLLDVAAQVLDEEAYERLIARLAGVGGETGGPAAAEEDTGSQTGA